MSDQFELVRAERDPVQQAKLATELIGLYQQRGVELARLRRNAIEEAADKLGISMSAVAERVGISRSRVTQIRQSAPPDERAFFGVGPITIGTPLRTLPSRPAAMIAREDLQASRELAEALQKFQFTVIETSIHGDELGGGSGDYIAICGPKSSPLIAETLQADPYLSFAPDQNGLYSITERATGRKWSSPLDHGETVGDRAYVGRIPVAGRSTLIIAGIHAIGSLHAMRYVVADARYLYETVGTANFSMVIEYGPSYDDTYSQIVCEPQIH